MQQVAKELTLAALEKIPFTHLTQSRSAKESAIDVAKTVGEMYDIIFKAVNKTLIGDQS